MALPRQGLYHCVIPPKTEHLYSEPRKGTSRSSRTVSDHLYPSPLFIAVDADIALELLASVLEELTEVETLSLLQKGVKTVAWCNLKLKERDIVARGLHLSTLAKCCSA